MELKQFLYEMPNITLEMNWYKILLVKSWYTKQVCHKWNGTVTYEQKVHIWIIIFVCEIVCEIFVREKLLSTMTI